MRLPQALGMLHVIYRQDFEDKAFAAWCAYGGEASWGEYLAALDAKNAPLKTREEIYRETDAAFEGR